jgi:hypothetical protein
LNANKRFPSTAFRAVTAARATCMPSEHAETIFGRARARCFCNAGMCR